MRTDLEGLFANISRCLKNGDASYGDYYAGCLDELLEHVKQTVAGEHTLEEFAEFYCLKEAKR